MATASELKVRISADTSGVKKGIAETKKQVKSLSKEVKETTKQTKTQLSGLGKTLLKLATLTHAFRKLTKATKEGIDNIYQYSKAYDTAMSKNMDKLASVGLYFKNSLGALVAPIINIITPAVEYIVQKIIQAMNYISKTIAELTGQKTWTKAVYYQTEYKDSIDRTTKSANRLKATLLGIDELNILSKDGGSGGVAQLEQDYRKMFEEVEVEGKKTFGNIIEDFITSGKSKWSLFAGSAATILGLKLSGALDGIFGTAGAGSLLGKFTAVLLTAFGGFKLGNWLYYNVPGIQKWADDLMELIGPGIDKVVNFFKGVPEGWKLLYDEAVEWGNKINGFFGGVKEGWSLLYDEAVTWGDKIWKAWDYLTDDGVDIHFHTSVDAEAWENFRNNVDKELQQIKSAHQNAFNFDPKNDTPPADYTPNFTTHPGAFTPTVTTKKESTGGISSIMGGLLNNISNSVSALIPKKAGGGFVDSGQLFMARENGQNELVGHIGNKTAVANNDQIVSALSLANEGVIDTLIQTNRMLINAIENKDMSVSIGDDQITRACARGNNLYKKTTGVSLI